MGADLVIDHDDDVVEFMEKVNAALERHGVQFVMCDTELDGQVEWDVEVEREVGKR